MRIPSTATTRTRPCSRRPPRGMAGFTLIDSLLGLLISAVLIAPVLGGVFVILKTAPGASTQGVGLSVTRNQTQVFQNFQLTNATSTLTDEWRQASIIKLLDTYQGDLGNECNNGTSSSALDSSPYFNKPLIALQTIGKADSQTLVFDSVRGLKLARPMGLTRVVYNLVTRRSGGQPVLRPDGTKLQDLVRRECAVESTGLPKTNPAALPNADSCNDQNAIYADCKGWRLQPGTVNKSSVGSVSWTSVRTVISNVQSVTKVAVRARPTGLAATTTTLPGAPAITSCNAGNTRKGPLDPDYDQCDVTLVVTFGDEDTDPSNNRVEKIYLSQGFGA
jgi:hypothetical protein